MEGWYCQHLWQQRSLQQLQQRVWGQEARRQQQLLRLLQQQVEQVWLVVVVLLRVLLLGWAATQLVQQVGTPSCSTTAGRSRGCCKRW
jgi:hypothetical protein